MVIVIAAVLIAMMTLVLCSLLERSPFKISKLVGIF